MSKKVIIHCSDTPDFRPHNAADIHRWHKERGWDGIGYHWVIGLDGLVEAGRPEYWYGSHCRGYNDAIGICLIGTSQFTDAQWKALKLLISQLQARYSGATIHGHNEFSDKTCPGFDVQEWVRSF